MTTRMAMEALSELSEKINDDGIDLGPKTYYSTAIDTAIKALDNYERLLEEMQIRARKERRMLKEEQETIKFLREFMSDAVHETAKQFRRQEGR